MPIPGGHAHRYAFHFSHIDNLPGLLARGFLPNNHPDFPRKHRSVAAGGIQQRRAQMAVPCGPGGCVHDYVPLYFGSVSPMLLGVVNAKNVDRYDLLFFEFPIALADRADAVFTDASANTDIPPIFYSDPADLDRLDWPVIDCRKWGNVDDAFRHRRMAELLVRGPLPATAAARCVVWNDDVKTRVQGIVGRAVPAHRIGEPEPTPLVHRLRQRRPVQPREGARRGRGMVCARLRVRGRARW